jgi:hypothetical protein
MKMKQLVKDSLFNDLEADTDINLEIFASERSVEKEGILGFIDANSLEGS